MKKTLIFFFVLVFLSGASNAYAKDRKTRTQEPNVSSFLIADETGSVVQEKNRDLVRPIASITKLMVAMLVVEQDLEEMLPIPGNRYFQTSIPRSSKELSRKDLLILSLVKSDNFASDILCNHIPDCVGKMNLKSQELSLYNTKFVEPTGLSKENVSTAGDLLKLVMAAYSSEIIKQISSMPTAEIFIEGRSIRLNNTNPLTSKFKILLSKTGYTNPAGGCLVMVMASQVGQRVLILLGSKNTKTRITDMEKLIKKL